MSKQTLIVITGPTAVGKTALTIQLAQHYGVPIINADSRQIYRELPIGTAAPSKEQLRQVRHYFVASKSIDDYYNASMYEQEVLECLKVQPSNINILSGGSMMYIDAVCNGIDDIPTIREDIREEMKRRYQEESDSTPNTTRSLTSRTTDASSMPWKYAIRQDAPTPRSARKKRKNDRSTLLRLV